VTENPGTAILLVAWLPDDSTDQEGPGTAEIISSMRLEFVGNLLDAKEARKSRGKRRQMWGPKVGLQAFTVGAGGPDARAPHDMVTRIPPCEAG
jgi:hypothetical protein